MSMKMVMLVAAVAASAPMVPIQALAVSKASAQNICINAAATQHNALRGTIQVRRAKPHSSGYEFGLVIDGREINCIVSKSGKIRYLT